MTSHVQSIEINSHYFKTPHAVYEKIQNLLHTVGEIKVMFAIVKHTIGWHKTEDKISLSQFEQETGLCRTTIITALKSLIKLGLIEKIKSYTGSIFRLVIDKLLDQSASPIIGPTKDNLQKKNLKTTIKTFSSEVVKTITQPKLKSVVVQEVKKEEIQLSNLQINSTPEMATQAIKLLVNRLVDQGVNVQVARRLVMAYPLERIEEQLKYIQYRECEDKSAMLVASIKQGFSPPKTLRKQKDFDHQVQKCINQDNHEKNALETAKNSTHIKLPSGTLLEIKSVTDRGWIDYYIPTETGKRLDSRPINVILMNEGIEFIRV